MNEPQIDVPSTPKDTDANDPDAVFRQLKAGLGHELINDGNVDAVLAVAKRHGHLLIEQELREWKSSCA